MKSWKHPAFCILCNHRWDQTKDLLVSTLVILGCIFRDISVAAWNEWLRKWFVICRWESRLGFLWKYCLLAIFMWCDAMWVFDIKIKSLVFMFQTINLLSTILCFLSNTHLLISLFQLLSFFYLIWFPKRKCENNLFVNG